MQVATRIRVGMGLSVIERMDVAKLAERYEVALLNLSELECSGAVRAYLSGQGNESISGMVFPYDGEHVAVINDRHDPERIRSTVTHEISHVVLQHTFALRMMGLDECSEADRDQEDEATELGGELLIPRQTARSAAFEGKSEVELAEQFGVSVEMARWRMNVSGGRQIRTRAR